MRIPSESGVAAKEVAWQDRLENRTDSMIEEVAKRQAQRKIQAVPEEEEAGGLSEDEEERPKSDEKLMAKLAEADRQWMEKQMS